MMHQFDYETTKMAIAERHHAAEQRRMIREARLAAKAARPRRNGSHGAWRGALATLFSARPWKHVTNVTNHVVESQLLVEAQGR
jgi:hypothetical protein